MSSLPEEAEMPQLTRHLDNPLSAGAVGTGEGTVLLAAFGITTATTNTNKTEIHLQKLKQTPDMGEYNQNEV